MKPPIRFVASLALVAVLAVAALVGASSPASGATIDGAITDVTIREGSAGAYSQVHVDLAWAVPDSARAGDTFSLTLPDSLRALNRSFDLRAPDGSLVATASVDGGVVTFTLTDYADTHDAVRGTAFLEADFVQGEIEPGETNSFTFTTSVETYTDTVDIPGVGTVDRTKSRKFGYWYDRSDQGASNPQGALRWVLETPVGPWQGSRFVDSPTGGHTIDCASVRVLSLTGLDRNGEATSSVPADPSRYQIVSCSGAGLVVTTGPIADGEVIQVNYGTDITDPALGQYGNEATISVDGQATPLQSRIVRSDAGGEGEGSTTSTTTSTSTTSTVPPSTTSTTVAPSSTTSTTAAPITSTTDRGSDTSVLDSGVDQPPPSGPRTGSLPRTGSTTGPLAGTGLALLATGAGCTVLAWLRRRHGATA